MNNGCAFYSKANKRCYRRENLTNKSSIKSLVRLVGIGNWEDIVAPLVSDLIKQPSNGEPIGNEMIRCMVPTINGIPILSVQVFCNGYCSPKDKSEQPMIDRYTTVTQTIGMIVQLLSHEDKT